MRLSVSSKAGGGGEGVGPLDTEPLSLDSSVQRRRWDKRVEGQARGGRGLQQSGMCLSAGLTPIVT